MTEPLNPIIELRNVTKTYGKETRAVQDVSLAVEEGALLALLGASGCGKTTILRLIAGLERPDSGSIWLNGRQVAGGNRWVEPENRQIGMVFQDYALFPHLTIEANVAFPLNKLSGKQRRTRIAEVLEMVGLPDLGKRYPHQLSGGQQQRVALARAMAPNPTVILLDEPFSNLDAAMRKSTREEVRQILRDQNATAIFVTHDQEEALSLANEVAVMRAGEILQVGTPHDVYLRPTRRSVAEFIGEVNFIPGTAEGLTVKTVLGSLPLSAPAQGEVQVLIRPEMIDLMHDKQGVAEITFIQFLGFDQLIQLQLPQDLTLTCRTRSRIDLQPGQRVNLRVNGRVLSYPD